MPEESPSISHALTRLAEGGLLSELETRVVFDSLLTGGIDRPRIEAMLLAFARRGPTVDELVGAARSLRAHATPVRITDSTRPILDTCGTGGAPKLFNVSTIGAIVTAAAAAGRVLVAKHGNRSRTGRGSAEVLEGLGINIAAGPDVQARCLDELGICFSFAPEHHPGARHAAEARKALGIPTIFNLLGPLANPAGATCQLVGTYSRENAEKLAAALAQLGTVRAMVATSRDGLDELTTTDVNFTWLVGEGVVAASELDAARLFPRARIDDLRADSLSEAVDLARLVLSPKSGPSPALDMVLLNVAGSLMVSGVCRDWPEGIDRGREAIGSGAAEQTLARWVELSRG